MMSLGTKWLVIDTGSSGKAMIVVDNITKILPHNIDTNLGVKFAGILIYSNDGQPPLAVNGVTVDEMEAMLVRNESFKQN